MCVWSIVNKEFSASMALAINQSLYLTINTVNIVNLICLSKGKTKRGFLELSMKVNYV